MKKLYEHKKRIKNELDTVRRFACRVSMALALSISIVLGVSIIEVGAQSTSIQATLCDHQGPEITIFTPSDKSTVNTGSVLMRASTTRTTQVDVFVNEVYSHTTALTYGEDLETEIALNEGENNVRLRAHFSCNQTSAEYNMIIFYDRNSEPDIEDQSGLDRRNTASIIPIGSHSNIEIIDRILDRLTGAYIYKPDYVRLTFSWFSFAILVIGLYLVLYPKRLGNKVIGRIKNIQLHHRIDLLIRIIGILIILMSIIVLAL